LDNNNIHTFEFLNYSQRLGGKIGINLSRNTIIDWYKKNKYNIFHLWSDDFPSKRLINIIYNYDFISSSSNKKEIKTLKKIILVHIYRVVHDYKYKDVNDISSYDILANTLSNLILNKDIKYQIPYIEIIINSQIDKLGMHKSYNIIEHSKYLNNLYELKNILLYFKVKTTKKIEEVIIKMTSILNEYFHLDGSIPLFNGSNNNYTKNIYDSLNTDDYLIKRTFSSIDNGLAFLSDKNKKLFFDVVQPNKKKISKNLSAGTLSFEFSAIGEKIITNCGASEGYGKNPEYLRYSAAHSTIILQNTNISEIKEKNPHIKFPQSVTFESNSISGYKIFEGSHNGYQNKFNRIVKRKLKISEDENKIYGEDSIISIKNTKNKIIYHIRFHLADGLVYNFTNNKKNIILRSNLRNMWLFKSDNELTIEDSIIVDKNTTIPTKQIVIRGITDKNKHTRKWSLEKI
ncbi:heparinase II/III-family protein, partial [Pelagibacteraceae bacterium]|nr:heparinase II/III-family protein [Pelagibacteraceae bacterium]